MRDIMEELKRLKVVQEDYNALKKAFDSQEKRIERLTELLNEKDKLIDELREAHRRQGIELSVAQNNYDSRVAQYKFLERYNDKQAHKIMELEWEIHQLKEADNE